MNKQFSLLNREIKDIKAKGTELYNKSVEVVKAAQTSKGGMAASPSGTRYAGYIYPRDHAYSNRALLSANKFEEGKNALSFILNCPLSEDKVMFQRYSVDMKDESYKPPQIDGNAQTIISLSEYVDMTGDSEFLYKYKLRLKYLIEGITNNTQHFEHGDLVFSQNGIIEFSPFEEGFEIYTNACCYRGLISAADLFKKYFKDSDYGNELLEKAEKIKKGISYFLYHPKYGGYVPCLRTEPNSSVVTNANLKAFLSMSDFDVFPVDDEKMKKSLEWHLKETQNKELGGYNRYAESMSRHNFGNGPWPMVMLRLADWYFKSKEKNKLRKCINWVLNVALNNQDVEFGLPEHVSTKEEFTKAYESFIKMNETAPRPAKLKQYETIMKSKTFTKKAVGYAVNPLVWSHAQFIMTWNKVKDFI